MRIISDETIRELLREASFRSDSLMVSVCRAALFGCSDARNQLAIIWRLHTYMELGARLEEAMEAVDAQDLEALRKAAGINGFEPT